MSENRIRRTDTQQPASPGGSGVWVGAVDNTLKYNPDGTTRYVAPIDVTVPLVAATVSETIWIAPFACELVSVREVHRVASSSGTLQVQKLTGTTAPGSGTNLLTGTVSLAGTANTVVSGTLIGTTASLRFAAGDRLGTLIAGTMTSLAGGVLVCTFKQI